ncbi:hypothetical protein [Roseateles sp. P5_D6]
MNIKTKYLAAFAIAALSTLLFAVAFGTQEAWRPALLRWNCDSPMPEPPGAWQAITALSMWLWMLGMWNSLILFSLAARQFRGWRAVAWSPILAGHLFMRLLAYMHSKAAALDGVCGARDETLVATLFLEFAAVILVPVYAAMLAVISAKQSEVRRSEGS